MRRLIWNLSLAGACAGALLCGPAAAQTAKPTTGASAKPAAGAPDDNKSPIDITADKLDKYDDQRLVVYTGNVEAVQNGVRLNCDVLRVYFDPPTPAPGQPAKASNTSTASAQDGFGNVRQMVADGHVFYVTQSQTVRADHGVYDAAPDTVTATGGVVVVQGKNVQRGDKMVMELKTGHTQVFSNATGRNKPDRVRGVFYSEGQGGAGQGSGQGQAQGKPGQGKPGQGKPGQGKPGQAQGDKPAAPAKP